MIEPCVAGLRHPVFENYIETDGLSIAEAAERAAALAGLTLCRGRDGYWKAQFHRLRTQWDACRWLPFHR